MQHFKKLYSDSSYIDTFSNIQKCLRLNDLHEVGDGTHFLIFEMIGLFSFRSWTLKKSVLFMYEFLEKLNIKPDYVTLHPDKELEWSYLYEDLDIEIKLDPECVWSDGSIGGYCTEFYKDDIEIGNIVNTLGNCIDIGFGLERLLQVSNSLKSKTRLEILEDTSLSLINSGTSVGHNKEQYILKKLITECVLSGSKIDNIEFENSRKRLKDSYQTYIKNKDKPKYKLKPENFWLDTFGVDISRISDYEEL